MKRMKVRDITDLKQRIIDAIDEGKKSSIVLMCFVTTNGAHIEVY